MNVRVCGQTGCLQMSYGKEGDFCTSYEAVQRLQVVAEVILHRICIIFLGEKDSLLGWGF